MEHSIKLVNKILGLALVVFLVQNVMSFKYARADEVHSQQKSYITSALEVDRTLDCLALNVYREAGHESFEGKVAVAQVVLNRVDNPNFPKSVCAVVYQRNIIMEHVVCQFSWNCIGVSQVKPNDDAYKESYAVAKKVLLEGFRMDGLKDALYYHATYINPSWPYEKITTIGNHVFFKGK